MRNAQIFQSSTPSSAMTEIICKTNSIPRMGGLLNWFNYIDKILSHPVEVYINL